MRVTRSFPHYPAVVCPACGKKLSALFSLEEHQRSPGCKARQNVRELMATGWTAYSSRAISTLRINLDLGSDVVREVLIPEDVLTIPKLISLKVAARGRDHTGTNIIIGYMIRDWLATVLDSYRTALQIGQLTFNDLLEDPRSTEFPPVLMNLVDQIYKNESHRADVLAAIRLGGFRAAVDISKTWK